MNIFKRSSSIGFVTGMLLSMFTGHAAAALNISQKPLSLADQVASNVMVMLDNSGSMKIRMYQGINFDPNSKYSGIFEETKNYEYDPLIPVKASAYPYMVDDSTPPNTMIDTNATGAFVESSCALPADANAGCWSGNFLNWLTTRRIDASRDVLVGGKVESRTPLNYNSAQSTGLNSAYKIVANNEPADSRGNSFPPLSHASSNSYSPIPDGQSINVLSPADNGDFKTAYDPYAKITTQTTTPIYDSATNVIGEFNTITLDEQYKTITLGRTYVNPVIISKAPSFNGSDPSIVRIKNVTTNSFEIRIKEWDYISNQNHTNESLSFIVIESGEHELSGGLKLKAGITSTDQEYVDECGTSRTNSASVSFGSWTPANTPIVITSIMSEQEADAVNSRVWNVSTTGFTLALQEEENKGSHASETIGYLAIEPGTVDDTTRGFKLEAATVSSVTNATSTITYTSTFANTPAFVGAMQTLNEFDTAALRLDSNNSTTATLHVEEEKSCNSETSHAAEDVGYVAIEGRPAGFNLAVMTTVAPTGILHEVKDKVRLGISFYRFNPNKADIYNGVTTQGGTLRFKIPKNPFVKKPSETNTALLPTAQQGFRTPELEGYVGTSIADIVDAVEHYPLIWGTTPLAENLVEVIKYFEQSNPYYTDMVSGFPDFVKADASNPERDPFYIPTYAKKLQCVNNTVLIVTDGEPFRDANIDPIMLNYDGDSKSGDSVSTDANASNSIGNDNLDDVAYWAFCDTSGGTCIDPATGKSTTLVPGTTTLRTNLRDLRPEAGLPGDQYLKIDTIGFAGNSIRQILQDTADNAGGTAYPASDGAQLEQSLKDALDNATRNSSASAVSANSTRLNGDTLIYQASLDSADWSGQLQGIGLDANGDPETTPTWHTDSPTTFANPGTRKVFTYKPTHTAAATGAIVLPVVPSGIAFNNYADLGATQKAALDADTTVAQAQIDYLRGDTTNDGQGLGFRARTVITTDPVTNTATTHKRLLGDIANSNPWFVGKNNFGYGSLPGNEGSRYQTFLTTAPVSNRIDALYVGSNDGMLHAFDAATGVEKFAYVPSTVFPNLTKLLDPEYGKIEPHQYFVDGSPRAGDVYINGAWKTILVGTTGAGGRGLFALDVTDPDAFDATKVLFEFNDTNDLDMGATLTEPTIVRMANGKWSIIMGNGYNSDSGEAILYIIDIEGVVNQVAGSVTKIHTKATGDNGLGTPVPVDINGDHTVDAIYAGDLKGNLWKFDMTDAVASNWKTAFGTVAAPVAMFTATDASSTAQPITAKPQVGRHPDGGVMVYFGTGKFFEEGDDNVTVSTPQIQTFYGLRDNFANAATKPITARSQLQQQTITYENLESFDVDTDGDGIADDTVNQDARVTSNNDVLYNPANPAVTPAQKGWYLDLHAPSVGGKGERVIGQASLNGGRILFPTMAPNPDPCASGGSGWLMLLDGVTGKRVTLSSFDFNEDGLFETDDYVTATIDGSSYVGVGSGIRSGDTGKIGSSVGDGNTINIYTNENAADGSVKSKKTGVEDLSGIGRQSWRQLR